MLLASQNLRAPIRQAGGPARSKSVQENVTLNSSRSKLLRLKEEEEEEKEEETGE
jgi:hypothetical protein